MYGGNAVFRIGEFSRLTRVPITTLHHYDEIGLFRPVHSDPFSGYRYYGFEQLPRLNRILALRGLGFSLEQIGRMLGDDDAIAVSADELRAMLTLRRAELEQQVTEGRERLAQVEQRLAQIEQEGKMTDVEVLVKDVEARTIAGAREVVADAGRMRERCIALNDAACALIEAARLKTDAVSFALYYRTDAPGIDVEMAYAVEPLGREVMPVAGASVHTLPAATVAYAVYRGSYDDFGAVGQLHAAIARWIDANGYRVTEASREYYLRPPQKADDDAAVMEIQYPIARKG
jgi:DNA-binding transcriptional MerR regulator